MFGEAIFYRLGDVGGFHDPLIRGFGQVVAFEGLGADAFFVDEFYGRQEEVVKEPPFVTVEIVEGWNDLGVV